MDISAQTRVETQQSSIDAQLALQRAYEAFRREYPQWAASLFDEHFLTHNAAPYLAGGSEASDTFIARALANAWADQLSLSAEPRRQLIVVLTPAAARFVKLFERELRTQAALTLTLALWG